MSPNHIIPTLKSLLGGPIQVTSKSWEDRTTILQPDVNLFCWTRKVDTLVKTYIEEAVAKQIPPIHIEVEADSPEASLIQARQSWQGFVDQGDSAFWEDVTNLVRDFLMLTKRKSCGLFLGLIETDACTKFHTDRLDYRLLTTYYGPGTEWLPEKALDRKALGKYNELIIKDPSQIQRMDRYEVGILKGEKPETPFSTKGIVHRSPSIESADQERIILRLDSQFRR